MFPPLWIASQMSATDYHGRRTQHAAASGWMEEIVEMHRGSTSAANAHHTIFDLLVASWTLHGWYSEMLGVDPKVSDSTFRAGIQLIQDQIG